MASSSVSQVYNNGNGYLEYMAKDSSASSRMAAMDTYLDDVFDDYYGISAESLSEGYGRFSNAVVGSSENDVFSLVKELYGGSDVATAVRRPFAGVVPRMKNKMGKLWIDNDKKSHATYDFTVQSFSVGLGQRNQIFQAWDAVHVLAYGDRPVSLVFNGVLLNTEDFQWLQQWDKDYNAWIKPSKAIPSGLLRFKVDNLMFSSVVVDSFNLSGDATHPNGVSFSCSVVVLDWSVVKDTPLPRVVTTASSEDRRVALMANGTLGWDTTDPLGTAASDVGAFQSQYVINPVKKSIKLAEWLLYNRAIGMSGNQGWSEEFYSSDTAAETFVKDAESRTPDIMKTLSVKYPGSGYLEFLFDEAYDAILTSQLRNAQFAQQLTKTMWHRKVAAVYKEQKYDWLTTTMNYLRENPVLQDAASIAMKIGVGMTLGYLSNGLEELEQGVAGLSAKVASSIRSSAFGDNATWYSTRENYSYALKDRINGEALAIKMEQSKYTIGSGGDIVMSTEEFSKSTVSLATTGDVLVDAAGVL